VEQGLPWRALEAEDAPGPADRPAPPSAPPGSPSRRRPLLFGAIVVAAGAGPAIVALLAVLAVLAAPVPSIVLPGDAASPGSGVASVARSGLTGPSESPDLSLVIDVSGAVARPGVYRLPDGSRIADAISAAGGFGPRVDAAAAAHLNLAAPLRDGDQVFVPSRDDPAGAGAVGPGAATSTAPNSASAAPAGPLDLNRATEAELDTLPGIGPVTARKIVASRTESPFTAVEDLRTRKLVTDATFAKLGGLVTVTR
jgi:competence protein ComEA